MSVRILTGDARLLLANLPDASVQCCVTSPPYANLRDYGHPDQIGAEATAEEYISELVSVFRRVRRVLRDDGTLWLNLGDGMANKQLRMIPARVALALQADGWWLRSDIIWAKPNPMPESVQGSHFSRHMVTIAEYERLSGLPYSAERADEYWASDVPSLSETEMSGGEAPLSAERERQSNGSRSGGAAGRAGKAASVRCLGAGQEEPGQILENREGQRDSAEGCREIFSDPARQAQSCGASLSHEGYAAQDCSEETGGRCLRQDGQDGGKEAEGLCAAESRDSSRHAVYGRDVAGDGEAPQEPLLLLQGAQGSNPRPRDPAQQGRKARSDEHRPSMSRMQFEKEQQADPSRLVPCPGCDKCSQHNGYTFHLSAGRPTSSHEHVFLLSKREQYFYDADAVAEPADSFGRQHSTDVQPPKMREHPGKHNGDLSINYERSTRSLRNVWTIATQPYSGAHFATMPATLASICVRAGTSERGQCGHCASPWARVVELGDLVSSGPNGIAAKPRSSRREPDATTRLEDRPKDGYGDLPKRERREVGWQPTCACPEHKPVPQTVLDPFSGAGTSLLVADRLGRNGIGIELNPQYADLARERLRGDCPMFAEVA